MQSDMKKRKKPQFSSMHNLLTLPFKYTQENTDQAVRLAEKIASSSKNRIHADHVIGDCKYLCTLKAQLLYDDGSVRMGPETLNVLLVYYAQLACAATKVPRELPYDIKWSPLFQDGLLSSPLMLYERTNILYTIAIAYFNLGVAELKPTEEGMKTSISHFQNAAGCFQHLNAILQSPYIRTLRSVLPDAEETSPPFLEGLSFLALAQQQEVAWQNAVRERLKNGSVARIAIAVSQFYDEAFRRFSPLQTVPRGFVAHIQAKTDHFSAVAHYRKSLDHLGMNEYGLEIRRLQLGLWHVKEARKRPKDGVSEAVLRDLKSLQSTVEANLLRAERDNNALYHATVPPAETLPGISGFVLARASIPAIVKDPLNFIHLPPEEGGISGTPAFAQLVSNEITHFSNVYIDRVRRDVDTEVIAAGRALCDATRTFLMSENLPVALEMTTHRSYGLPPSILQCMSEYRALGGVQRLKSMLADAETLQQRNTASFKEIEVLLASFDERTGRAVGANHYAKAGMLKKMLQQADSANSTVKSDLARKEPTLLQLGMDEGNLISLLQYKPENKGKSSRPSTAATTAERQLRVKLESFDDLDQQADMIVREAVAVSEQDDILEVLTPIWNESVKRKDVFADFDTSIVPQSTYEEIFQREMGKYDRFVRDMRALTQKQKEITGEVKILYAAFKKANTEGVEKPLVPMQWKPIRDLEDASNAFLEFRKNLKQGLMFYRDLAVELNTLKRSLE